MSEQMDKLAEAVELYTEQSTEAKMGLNEMLRSDQRLRKLFARYLMDEELLREELQSDEIQRLLDAEKNHPLLKLILEKR